MKRRNSYAIAGGFIGFFVGSSIGIAAGGTAINGAWVLAAITALIGWLVGHSSQSTTPNTDSSLHASSTEELADLGETSRQNDNVTAVLRGALELIASFWNFHIDLLQQIRLLKTFCERPWLFVAFGLSLSLLFPPFSVAYGISYLCASTMGANKDNQYRAQV